jgi:O-antigen/teichoic acid export membrane protein
MTEPGTHDSRQASGESAATSTDAELVLPARASIRRNIAQMTSAQAVTFLLALVLAVAVPRYLDPEWVGTIQVAASLWAIASIASIGTTMYLQLQLARDAREGLPLVGTVVVVRTGVQILAAGALTAYTYFAGSGRDFAIVVAITGTSVLLTAYTEVFSSAFYGLERMATPATAAIATKVLTVVGVLSVISLDLGVYGILSVGIVASAISLGFLVRRFHQVGRTDFSRWRGAWMAVIAASIPFTMVHLANTVYRQTDVIIISTVAGNRDVGWYAAGDVLIGTLLFPATVVLASVFPSFGRLHAHDPDGLVSLVTRTFSLLILVAVPIGLGTALVGPTFAPVLLGDDYSGTGEVLAVMGPVLILTYGTTLVSQVALASGRGKFWTLLLFLAAGMTIPLDLVLVPWASDRFDNGAIGGALAYVLTELTQFVVGVAFITPFLVSRRSLWTTSRVLAAGGVMCVVVWPVREMFVLIPAVVGAVAYGGAIFALRVVDDYQRHLIRTTVARIRPR